MKQDKEPRAMFAIGGDDWPGLAKVAEECSEVTTIVSKLMGTGGNPDYWDGQDLRQRLIDELGDAVAAIEFATHYNGILDEVMDRAKKKLELFESWRNNR